MKKTLGTVILLLSIVACSEKQSGIQDYESRKVKFAKKLFTSNNGEFSMTLPKNWSANEDPVDSDTLLYYMQAGPQDMSFTCLNVSKLSMTSKEIDQLVQQYIDQYSNVKLVEKSKMKIDNIVAKTVMTTQEQNEQMTHEQIEIFIPISKGQYYSIGMGTEKNDNTERNFAIMLECAKSFKLKK